MDWDVMGRYYFHTKDGRCLTDNEGTELRTFEDAQEASVELLGELICQDPRLFWDTESFSVIVSDAGGSTLFTLDLSMTASASAPAAQAPDADAAAP